MGPEFWGIRSPTRLKKCAEFKLGTCNTETDGCCAVVPCSYCLYFTGSYSYTGYATFVENGWLGTINESTFFAYWERNYDTGECEFVVLIDGYEVYRKSCYEGQSCRDSSDSVETTIGDQYGTLTWTRIEQRPLEYIRDPDTGCVTWFCGTCECTCECLCVTIVEVGGTTVRGEVCDTSYPCDGPVWAGLVGDHDISVSLIRDEVYGGCLLLLVHDGEEADPVAVAVCNGIDVTFTLYDGTTVRVVCKVCDCDTEPPIDLPFCLCSPLAATLGYSIMGSGSGACTFSGNLEYTERFLTPSWVSEAFTLPTTPTPLDVKLKLSCIPNPGGYPVNGFLPEDYSEVNTPYWYEVSFILADESGTSSTAIPFNYRDPDTVNGWVGRCLDGFLVVTYFLNTICGGVGDGLVTVLITE